LNVLTVLNVSQIELYIYISHEFVDFFLPFPTRIGGLGEISLEEQMLSRALISYVRFNHPQPFGRACEPSWEPLPKNPPTKSWRTWRIGMVYCWVNHMNDHIMIY
jgi:hypothetical protein